MATKDSTQRVPPASAPSVDLLQTHLGYAHNHLQVAAKRFEQLHALFMAIREPNVESDALAEIGEIVAVNEWGQLDDFNTKTQVLLDSLPA